MLTERQLLTVQRLNEMRGITEPADIIAYCEMKMSLPRKTSVQQSKNKNRPRRTHARKYYQFIIDYFRGIE